MVCASPYLKRWAALTYLLLHAKANESLRQPSLLSHGTRGVNEAIRVEGRALHRRSEPVDEVFVDSDHDPVGDRPFYGAPGKNTYWGDDTSQDTGPIAYTADEPSFVSSGRLVKNISEIEFVTDHKLQIPTGTGYLRINLDISQHLSLINMVVKEIDRLAKRGSYSPTQSQNQFIKSLSQRDASGSQSPSVDGTPIKGWNTLYSPMFDRRAQKDHILGTDQGGMADKDNPKYDTPGGVEMSGAFKYTAEDFLTMDFATEALRLQAQRCLARSNSSAEAFQYISVGKRSRRSLGWSLANTALGIGGLVAAAVIDGKVTSQSKRFDAMSVNVGGIVSRMNRFAMAIPNMARAIGRRMTLPTNLNTARIDQTQVLSLVHALVDLACHQSESYVQSLDVLAQGKVPVSLFQREVWETAFKAFKTKMKRIKLMPVVNDPSIIFRTRVTTLVVKEKNKAKLRIAIPISLVPDTENPYSVYRMLPSILLLGDKPFFLETDTMIAVRPGSLPIELRPSDLASCEKPFFPFLRTCNSLPEGRNTSCLSDLLQQRPRAECSHLLRAIDEKQVFVNMSPEGRVVVYSSESVSGRIICPNSNDVDITIPEKTPSSFHVLPPCQLEVKESRFVPKTFDKEITIESFPDPSRQLNVVTAQILNGVESLLNKRQSTKSVTQLYAEMIDQGYNGTNLEDYLSANPIEDVYHEVSGTLTPYLPVWVTALTSVFFVMTFLALVCVLWDSCRKRKARHERAQNRERFVQASRLRNFDVENPQFVNLMRLL